MYADRVEATSGRSVKDRLNGNSDRDSTRRRQITGKRQRQDDKWEHDLYEDAEPHVSNRKLSRQDLRLKLQKRNPSQAIQNVKTSVPGVRDLREKLSGVVTSQPTNVEPPKRTLETAKLARRNVAPEVPEPEIKKVPSIPPKKKSQQKAESSVERFLHSIGLEKYLINFQAEEVDMTALIHMTDEDLKAMGIPMEDELQHNHMNYVFATDLANSVVGFISGTKKEDTLGIGIQRLRSGGNSVGECIICLTVSGVVFRHI